MGAVGNHQNNTTTTEFLRSTVRITLVILGVMAFLIGESFGGVQSPVSVTVRDFRGVETQIQDLNFRVSEQKRCYGKCFIDRKSVTVGFHDGYLRVPFKKLNRIDIVEKPYPEKRMRLTLINDQIVVGVITSEPGMNEPVFSGTTLEGQEFSIPVDHVLTIVFPSPEKSTELEKSLSNPQIPRGVTVNTKTGLELSFYGPEILTYHQKKKGPWLDLRKAQQNVNIHINKVRRLEVIQAPSPEMLVILDDGTKWEGSIPSGHLAGTMDQGLFFMPFKDLVNANFEPGVQ